MKTINKIISTSLIAIPLIANAGDLKITNDTNFDLSFKINKLCSDGFGNVNSQTIKIVSESTLKKACAFNPKFCALTVYNKANCGGKDFAKLGLDTRDGVIYIRVGGNDSVPVSVSASAFDLIFKSPVK